MIKKNGFTLAELLGVIVILAIIVLIAFPPIINEIRKTKSQLSDATLKLIYSAAEIYVDNNQNTFPLYDGNNYCIALQTLVNSGELKEPVKDAESGKPIDLNKIVKVNITNPANVEYSIVDSDDCVVIDNTPIVNADNSGASVPMLSDNMIAIKWNGIEWIKADKRNPAGQNGWYNYDNQQWANVALITSSKRAQYNDKAIGETIEDADVMAYLVWIPRYKYQLFNTVTDKISEIGIDIVFESKSTAKSTGAANGEFLTHPAFTFGPKEISGFWVGKFETTGTADLPTIKPNVVALTNQNVNTQFTTAQKFNNTVSYGLTATNDAHMMKTMEWGAVAYLSQSQYGKFGNSTYTGASGLEKEIYMNNINGDMSGTNFGTITGCAADTVSADLIPSLTCPVLNQYDTTQGIKASTTGNVYGVYDMSGGSFERTMGAMYNTGNTTISVGSSGFSQAIIDGVDMAKYLNKYTYGITENDEVAYPRMLLGDATGETRSWNFDDAYMVFDGSPWFNRGCSYKGLETAGIFCFTNSDGGAIGDVSFRVALLGE